RAEHDRRLQEARRELATRKDLFGREVEKARLKGLIDEEQRLELTNRLVAVDPDGALRLDRVRKDFDSIRADFAEQKRRRIEAFSAQLNERGLAADHPAAYERIRNVLAKEDLVTAHEYLAIVERGEDLPTLEPAATGADFFGSVDGRSDFFTQVE